MTHVEHIFWGSCRFICTKLAENVEVHLWVLQLCTHSREVTVLGGTVRCVLAVCGRQRNEVWLLTGRNWTLRHTTVKAHVIIKKFPSPRGSAHPTCAREWELGALRQVHIPGVKLGLCW